MEAMLATTPAGRLRNHAVTTDSNQRDDDWACSNGKRRPAEYDRWSTGFFPVSGQGNANAAL